MRILTVLAVIGVACAAPSDLRSYSEDSTIQGSSLHAGSDFHGGSYQGASIHVGSNHDSSGGGYGGNLDAGYGGLNVIRNVYVYESPEKRVLYGPAPIVPKRKTYHNVIFVKTPEIVGTNEPIIISPTQTKNVVYVLSKDGQQGQRIIEISDAPQQDPEVYYIHYNEGENPILPDGTDLNTALGFSSGKSIGGGIGGGYGGASTTHASSASYDNAADTNDVGGLGNGYSQEVANLVSFTKKDEINYIKVDSESQTYPQEH